MPPAPRPDVLRTASGPGIDRQAEPLPAVRLMSFVLAGGLILMRTAAGSTAARKVDGMIVTFEADELDAAVCSGWAVTVTGRAALVTDVAARYRRLPLVP